MTAYVLLFRGVGGATQLPTAPLRAALTEAGFGNVATYINSGNAVLASGRPREEILAQVAALCAVRFSFCKDIHVRSRAEWVELVARSPFPAATAAPTSLHAAVLAQDPDPARIAALQAVAENGDELLVLGRVAYLHTPRGFGRSKLAARFDKGLGVPNTARNWNTVLRLLHLVTEAERD
ncbi:DUF1697 domain-containing protein [Rubellimicrobium roseum]|uniref:DUF1697 domain-containing protein n=1 Tax=Rubellimicrobium roseum TaxID=687525 RepID=A0A5C4NED4_9RHOB|nr:DUF1697 domain-containing protein [Rubellimicrobium roseum]TNC69860.1 DUF1697 domain-containing protein [Rubellimicrobium roseum]